LSSDRRARLKVGARACFPAARAASRACSPAALPAAVLIPVALSWAESRPDPALACRRAHAGLRVPGAGRARGLVLAGHARTWRWAGWAGVGCSSAWSSWSWDELDQPQLEGAVLGWRARGEPVQVVLLAEGLELARAALARRRPSVPA
jgi:hypothetical protein